MYLKRFETAPGQVLTYPILVAHERVPLWKRRSIKELHTALISIRGLLPPGKRMNLKRD
jgi:hypothetical protein